jgi:hypothetical protein
MLHVLHETTTLLHSPTAPLGCATNVHMAALENIQTCTIPLTNKAQIAPSNHTTLYMHTACGMYEVALLNLQEAHCTRSC